MKTVLLFLALGLAGLSSCSTKCPAYSSTKPATQTASSITASTAPSPVERQ
ncbi:hypothetical protein [Hymenobacter sp.]|uniref:hypothetical protein n=1 Tax=Hymenobacter sp. TaxID=1898978 RepID=UPI002ED96C8D